MKTGELPPASERLGSWRPDFLVEDDDSREENYRITEINARYSFNAFMHVIYGQEALNTALPDNSTLVSATDSETVSLYNVCGTHSNEFRFSTACSNFTTLSILCISSKVKRMASISTCSSMRRNVASAQRLV